MVRVAVLSALLVSVTSPTWAQVPTPAPSQPGPAPRMAMAMPSPPLDLSEARNGSGTSWLPDESSVTGYMAHGDTWMRMTHWNAFGQFLKTTGARGDSQAGSINWLMLMASRNAGGGLFTARAMWSAEPLTVGKCGYPDLFQSGESCNGAALHDRQHPHDLFMELAADYRHGVSKTLAYEIYGGLSGEPALGPVAYPHRPSAMPNPIAPISHHWLDSSHVTFGVATAGIYGRRWKAEGSVFNGREPDDRRYDFDLAALDSYAGRLWFMPTRRLALQVSAGHLTEAEDGHDLVRVTASASYHRVVNGRLWATTAAWGANREHGDASPAWLAETAMDLTARDQIFARVERVDKSSHDLVLSTEADAFAISKLQLGYTRWLTSGTFAVGVGGSAGISRVPRALETPYGSSPRPDLAMFVTLRPR